MKRSRKTTDCHRSATAMTAASFVEIVTEYLEQQLDEARKLWTEEHLAECDACRNYLEQMRQTIAALRDLGDETLEPASATGSWP